jgi:RNA polymerase sigma-70 factor (subfamily 1)
VAESLNTQVLIQRVQQGDQGALNDLLQRYQGRVLAAVRIRLGAKLRGKMESMDIVQEAMIDALRKVGTFSFKSDGDFLKYLNQVVLNQIRDQADCWKAKKRDMRREVPLATGRSSGSKGPLAGILTRSGLTPSKVVMQREQLALLELAMDRLAKRSKEYRELIIKVKLEGRTYGEIAAETGMTPDAVRMRVNRAEAALAKIYKDLDKDK